VLVGTDWYGYLPTIEWLAATGTANRFRLSRPRWHHVRSMVGDRRAGEQLIPTQAMLVANELRRRA
jgi:hypothetical protein